MPPSTARAVPVVAPDSGAGQVGDGGRDLVGGDQAAGGLAGLQGGAFGGGVGGGVEQAADPGGVGGAGVDAVDADALADVVGGHGEGQGEHGALAGASTAPAAAGRRWRRSSRC